jgi:cytochrome c biogenesis protein CcmG/thiol:disulfide interchange protein DsbE
MENNREIAVRHWVDDRLATLTAPVDWEPDTGAGMARFRRGRAARSRTTRMYLWTGAAASTIVAVLLAFPGPRVFAQRCVDACLAETAVAPSFLHRRAAAAQTGRQPAPDFALLDASGNTVRLSALRGQVVLLNFWATWCAPCQVEIPWFVALRQQYGGVGLAGVGVAMDDDGWESVRPSIATRGIDYPVVVGNDPLAEDFGGVDALPTTFLIDRSGRIATVHQGLVDLATIDAEIRDLLKEATGRM